MYQSLDGDTSRGITLFFVKIAEDSGAGASKHLGVGKADFISTADINATRTMIARFTFGI